MNGLIFGRFERKSLAKEGGSIRVSDPPTLRGKISARPDGYRQCSRCVMDTSDPEITFDEQGHCCHCTEFVVRRSKHRYQGAASDEALDQIIEEIKRAGIDKDYDSIVGVSGGADSSYLMYLAKQKGLRPLAVHMDNGWDSDKAVVNIKNVTDRLGFDYESFVLDWEEFKDLQLAFLNASIPEAETPTDMAIPAALHRVAAKYNVKYILSGGNLATEGILPKTWHYDVRDMKYFSHIQKTFGTKRLRRFPTFGYKTETYYKLIRGIKMVYPLNYVPYDKKEAIDLLTREFDWKQYGGKHHESRFTKFIQSYYLYEKFGIDYRRPGLSIQILDGKVRRDDAIEELKCRPYDLKELEEEKQFISKKLGVSLDEFESIINLPPKWYWGYPNDQKKLSLIYDLYRKLFRKEKLDRF
jgi:N-acetyl sugar amidotransferase